MMQTSSNPAATPVANNPASRQSADASSGLSSAVTSIREFLTFKLGAEEYGMDILRVQEIRSYEEPTRMVNAPSFIKGVINLRGVIVPIVDLRIKLNIDTVNYDEFTVVIILNIRGTVLGAVVDAVSDVVTLTTQSIKSAPQFETSIDSRFITGLAHLGERQTPRGAVHQARAQVVFQLGHQTGHHGRGQVERPGGGSEPPFVNHAGEHPHRAQAVHGLIVPESGMVS